MADKKQDKKQEVIQKRLQKAGLELRDGKVVAVCEHCGQEIVVENKPLAAPPAAALPRVAQLS